MAGANRDALQGVPSHGNDAAWSRLEGLKRRLATTSEAGSGSGESGSGSGEVGSGSGDTGQLEPVKPPYLPPYLPPPAPPPSPLPPTPPSAPPLPPLSPNEVTVTTVVQRYTIDATVDTFNTTAFTTRLAIVAGVPESSISLLVVSASVLVTATITTANAAQTQGVTNALALVAAATPAEASALLGVTMVSVEAPTVTVTAVLATPPSSPGSGGGGSSDDNTTIIIAAAAGGGGALVLVLLGAFLYSRRAGAKAGGGGGGGGGGNKFASATVEMTQTRDPAAGTANQPPSAQSTDPVALPMGGSSSTPAPPADPAYEPHYSASAGLGPRPGGPKVGPEELAQMRSKHKEIKAKLRDYETEYMAQHGTKPVKQRDWGPVWDSFNEYSNLRNKIKAAEENMAGGGQVMTSAV